MRRINYIQWTLLLSLALGSLLLWTACSDSTAQSAKLTEAQKTAINNSLKANQNSNMKFELLELPYPANALEPVISERTVNLHHGKHLNGYVTNLNKLIQGTEFENLDLVEIVKKSDGGIFNNAGQTLNHNYYFTQFSPNGGGEPTGALAEAINKKFGSFAEFKKTFEAECTSLFGSGWAWLSTDKDGELQITKETNAGNPVTKDLVPLLGIDVWEHAYYLDYENRRADHVAKLWDIIDWGVVGNHYDQRNK